MQLTLCNFSKRMNSTKQPTAEILAAGKTFNDVALKELTNIDNPKLVLAGATANDYAYNYAYIHDWGRYYHIKSADLRHQDIYHASLELDDLATYKSQILNTSAYVVYSSSEFNRWIRDDRIPVVVKNSEYISTQSAITVNGEPLFEASDDETVLITTISENEGLGTWVTTESGLNSIMAAISSDDSIFDVLQKQFSDAMGAIVQVIRLPIKAEHFSNDGSLAICLGKYTLNYEGQPVSRQKTHTRHIYATGSLGIPVTYTDFRYTEPYCKATITLPFIGAMDFPLSALAPDGGISWRLDVDVLTGLITYTLYSDTISKPIASFSGNCGGIVPLATTQVANMANAVQGLAGGLAGAGLSAITGNPLPALVGGVSAIAGGFFGFAQDKNTVIGSYSGGRSEFSSRVIKLTVEKFATANEPDNLTAIEGRPLCMVRTLSGLSGYVRTQGFSIDLNANSDVIKSINSKLDAGIYIE